MIFQHNDIESHRGNNLIQGYSDDAGYDIKSGEDVLILPGRGAVIETGLHVYIPSYLFGVVQGRSGLSINHNIETGNAGIIDPGFTGSIKVKLYNKDLNEPFRVRIGDRIAQLVFHVRPEGLWQVMLSWFRDLHVGVMPEIIDFSIAELALNQWPNSERGNNGFGSSGK